MTLPARPTPRPTTRPTAHSIARLTLAIVLLAMALSLLAPVAYAKDYFLTIGGGYNPTGNQVSLEKNILYFQRMLKDFGRDAQPHAIFFADGKSDGRDLQYEEPKYTGPKVLELLAVISNQTRGFRYQYRTHDVPRITGPSALKDLDRWFNDTGKKLTPSDRVFIYVTAHGGRGAGKTKHDTKLYLWNDQAIKVSEFVARLDKLPAETPVVMVMVQCFSGGFANTIFDLGDPAKAMSKANRAGFFATVETRVAAGCTPDINEANYREYSTYFFEAIYGKSRLGKHVDKPDYDGDGRISFAEAHAYTQIHSDTIDIPIKTSGAFLRKFSKTKLAPTKGVKKPVAKPNSKKATDAKGNGKQQPEANKTSKTGKTSKTSGAGGAGDNRKLTLLTPDSKYAALLATASPIDKAVLEQLSAKLKLKGDNRAKAARDRAKKEEDQRKKLAGERSKLHRDYETIRKRIFNAVRNRWPELDNRWHPRVHEAIQKEAAAIVKAIEGHREFKKLEGLAKQINDLDRRRLDHERTWAKCQRVLRVLENLALAANLPKVDFKREADYLALLEREDIVLGTGE